MNYSISGHDIESIHHVDSMLYLILGLSSGISLLVFYTDQVTEKFRVLRRNISLGIGYVSRNISLQFFCNDEANYQSELVCQKRILC